MAFDQTKMMQAIYDKIYDSLTMAPSGGRATTFARDKTLLSLRMPGEGIVPEEYANPFSPTNVDGSHAAAVKLARLVDRVPVLSPVYTPSGQSVEQLYGELVRAEVEAQPESEQQKKDRERFERLLFVDSTDFDEEGRPVVVQNGGTSPFAKRSDDERVRYRAALSRYQNEFLALDMSKPEDKRRWAILGPSYEAELDQAWRVFQSTQPGRVEEARNWLGQQGQSSAATLFSEARQIFEQKTAIADLDQPGVNYHISSVTPGNWFASSSPQYFADVTITEANMATSSDSRFGNAGGNLGVDFGLFAVSGGGSHSWSSHSVSSDTSNMRISFRYAVVDITRPWMRQSLFSFNNYRLNGRPRHYFSNGRMSASNTGLLPLIPQSLVITRDIQISAQWGHSELEVITKATSGRGGLRIGPFSIGGGGGSSSTSKRFMATFDGMTITVPGQWVNGCISTLVPASPPMGG